MTKKHTNIGSMTSLLTDRQVAAILSTSRATIWRRVTDRTLPQPVKIGHATRWLLSEIEAVIADAVAERDQETEHGR